MKEFNYHFDRQKTKKTILVAPLHWGLGHATRCIPIIRSLLDNKYDVLLGSDGAALLLLRKEFPQLSYVELPAYDVEYAEKAKHFKLKMFANLPKIKKAIGEERKLIKQLVADGKIQGIISDNRLGVRSKKVPSVIITHQLNVLSGNTSFFSSKLHQRVIRKFDECWVPDVDDQPNLSGKLGHIKNPDFSIRYIGPLSRMRNRELPASYDILALLSGPEPQRTMFEEKILECFKDDGRKVLLVRGVVEEQKTDEVINNMRVVNFMDTLELEEAINESDVVVSRSGYTTIMDLAALEKKAFFVPTPGQYEQTYLAKRLKYNGIVPSCKQEKFNAKKLDQIPLYQGLKSFNAGQNLRELFRLFERE